MMTVLWTLAQQVCGAKRGYCAGAFAVAKQAAWRKGKVRIARGPSGKGGIKAEVANAFGESAPGRNDQFSSCSNYEGHYFVFYILNG